MGIARELAELGSAYNSGGINQFRNRIINGAMMIDQRNAGASVSPLDTYTLDRWQGFASVASKYTVQQNAGSVTPPAGFTNYLGVTSSSAYSVGASERFAVSQKIEGLNCADLGWGTANAQSVTLSFWVRSSLTGTFGGVFTNSAYNRSYPYTYTINAANTWEQKTVTIVGDTTGTWLTTSGVGLQIWFSLGAGSSVSGTAGSWSGSTFLSATGATSVVGTSGATFYITGVQLEKGSTATSFDYRPYGTELALCQRYYVRWGSPSYIVPVGNGGWGSSTRLYANIQLPVNMRAAPTFAYGGTVVVITITGTTDGSISSIASQNTSETQIRTGVNVTGAAGTLTVGSYGWLEVAAGSANYLSGSAEL